jgi:hypothetical protein
MQLKLDFNGKKEIRITFACAEDTKRMLHEVAEKLNRDPSELAREYVIECVTRDRGKLMLLESRGEKLYVDMGK